MLIVIGVFIDDLNGWGYGVRIDIKIDVLMKISWFRFLYLGIIVIDYV